jgi:hypothetical protein
LAAVPSSATVASPHTRTLSTTANLAAADHAHEDQYDPPTGWLFGVKPGEKYQKEGWEGVWMWGFFGSLGLAVVAYAFKPDTSYVSLYIPFLFLRCSSSRFGVPISGRQRFGDVEQELTNTYAEYKHGLSRRHDDDWKLRVSYRNPMLNHDDDGGCIA